jgi:hypothetical protein
VTGALAFQSTIPVALGVALTPWELEPTATLAAASALAGGLVDVWSLHHRRRFAASAIVAWAALFATFVASAWAVG